MTITNTQGIDLDDEYEAPKVCISPLATRPVLYTDTVGGVQTCRDDLWAVTTDELNYLHNTIKQAKIVDGIQAATIQRLRDQQDSLRPDFLLNGTRFKLNFSTRGNVDVFHNYAAELQGRWVALVPAEDDAHLARQAAPEAPTLFDAEFLSKRLARVAKLVGAHIPEHFTHEQVAETAGTILGDIARKLETATVAASCQWPTCQPENVQQQVAKEVHAVLYGTPAATTASASDEDLIIEAVKRNNVYGVLPNSASTMSIGRAVLAAERHRAAQAGHAGAVSDTERLDFMATQEAWIAWTKDGESCRVFVRNEDGDTAPLMGWIPEAWAHSTREAIDAAIASNAADQGEKNV